MSSNKKLLVIIFSYNHENYIKQCIESLLMQKTTFDMDILISDDCSTDNTPAILKDYASKYPDRLKININPVNMGLVDHFKKALPPPHSYRYVKCLGGDDYWIDPLALQKQADYLDTHLDCSFCFHSTLAKYENYPHKYVLRPDLKLVEKGYVDLEDYLFGPYCTHAPSFMLRWDLLDKPLYDGVPEDFFPEDLMLIFKFLQLGKAGFINDPMIMYRVHDNGVSGEYKEEWFKWFLNYGHKLMITHYYMYENLEEPMKTRFFNETLHKMFKHCINIYTKNDKPDDISKLIADYPTLYEKHLEYVASLEKEKRVLARNPKAMIKKVLRAIIGKPIKRMYQMLNLY